MKNEVSKILRDIRPLLLPHFGKAEALSFKDNGSAANAVTELDIKAEEYLVSNLAKLDSSITFVGEENGGDRNSKKFWLADPIDGTGLFIRGLPGCTTMLALIDNGEVVMGAIYDFVRDDLYFAEKGGGAFCNDTKLQVSSRPIQNAYFGWETHLEKPENQKIFLKLKERVTFIKMLCAGYELAMIASGKLDGRVNFDPHGKDYDFAPGSLLIKEAGGMVANLGKTTYDYRNTDLIATNQSIFESLTSGPDALFPISK